MDPHPSQPGIGPSGSGNAPEGGVEADAFKDALSQWASTVTIVAAREGSSVHATTVTSFFPVSADPPLVAVSLGASAQVLPFLRPERRFVVSFLSEDQRRLASVYADSFPVDPSPFPGEGDPVVRDAVMALICTVREMHPTESGARLVVGRVEDTVPGAGRPLLYQRRGYRKLDPEE